jgi:hypothetical protein
MKFFEVDIDVFNKTIAVLISDHKYAYDYFERLKKGVELPDCIGFAMHYNNCGYIYLNEETYNYGTVAHEAVHMSWLLCANNRLLLNGFKFQSQEIQAYIVGYITEQIVKKTN